MTPTIVLAFCLLTFWATPTTLSQLTALAPPTDLILPTALDLSTGHLTLQGHKDTKHRSELLTVTRKEVTGQDRGPQHWVLWILGAEDSEAVTSPLALRRL